MPVPSARELQGLYVAWQPAAVPAPRLLYLNRSLAAELGLDVAALDGPAGAMRSVNPWVIPRNRRVEEALAAASEVGDLAPVERLLDALKRPYDESGELAFYAEAAPAAVTARYRTFCGTRSAESAERPVVQSIDQAQARGPPARYSSLLVHSNSRPRPFGRSMSCASCTSLSSPPPSPS